MKEIKSADYKISNDPVIRFCSFYALLYMGSLILGGVGIFLIVFGLMFFSSRVLARTPFGQVHIRRFFGFKEPERSPSQSQSRIRKIATGAIWITLLGLYTYLSGILIWMGIKFLLEDGFLNQNMIYILFFKFK